LNIVFDLDGTLINSKLRLYKLFQHLAPTSQLSFAEYGALKQNRFTNEMILANQFGYEEDAIARFVKAWMALIERPEFLMLDTDFPNVHDTLARLRKRARLYVCTARQHRGPTLEQLERLRLLPFFKEVLVTERQCSKESLVHRRVPELSASDWMLGDTGEDITVGKSLNLKTCGLLSGFLSEQDLLAYAPDLILNSVAEFDP
jgi:phosphoglycolate phosphatase